MQKIISIVVVVLLVVACKLPAERQRIDNFTEEDKYSSSSDAEVEVLAIEDMAKRWWKMFHDDELNRLIEFAFKNSPDLQQVRKRFEQAGAVARVNYANLLPVANISGEAGTTRTDSSSSELFSLSGAASYELDIWGKNRSSYRSNKLLAQASLQDVRVSAISLSASIVENWVRLRALRQEENLLKQQISTNQTILSLQNKRLSSGVASALDILQQKEILARSKAQLPDVGVSKKIITHQLAVLVGNAPSDGLEIKGDTIPEMLPIPDTGLPSDLLLRRPDVEAAWLRVISADWAVNVAKKDRLPTFSLLANYSTSDAAIDGLFSSWLLNLLSSVAQPVIDGGRRKFEIIRQQAIADERFQQYKQVVLNALREVEDALARNYYQQKELDALNNQLDAAKASLDQAQISYSSGGSSYINVLNGLTNVQDLERQLLLAKRDSVLFRIELYRALGLAEWTEEIIENNDNKKAENSEK